MNKYAPSNKEKAFHEPRWQHSMHWRIGLTQLSASELKRIAKGWWPGGRQSSGNIGLRLWRTLDLRTNQIWGNGGKGEEAQWKRSPYFPFGDKTDKEQLRRNPAWGNAFHFSHEEFERQNTLCDTLKTGLMVSALFTNGLSQWFSTFAYIIITWETGTGIAWKPPPPPTHTQSDSHVQPGLKNNVLNSHLGINWALEMRSKIFWHC